MKRQADVQLSRDTQEEDDTRDDGMPEQGMKIASEAELGRRTIRPLPSRTKSSASTTSSAAGLGFPSAFGVTATGGAGFPSKTSTFAGFGVKTTTPEATAFTSNSTSATNNAFSSNSSTPFAFKQSQPASFAPPAATSTSKAFASLLSDSAASPFGASASAPSGVPSSAAPTSSKPGTAEEETNSVKYYKNLRGLNLSLVAAITKSVEGDPYVDLTDALERYKAYRSKVQADFGESPKTNGSSSQTPSTPTPTPTSSSSANKTTAMPAPPPSFSGFGGFKLPAPVTPASETATSNSTGFKPSAFGSSSTPSSFSFASDNKTSSFSFGASPATPASSTVLASTPFSFGSSPASGSTPAAVFTPFGTAPSQPSTSPSNPFGTTPSQSASAFGKASEKSSEKLETSSSLNPFAVPEKAPSTSFFSGPKSSTNAPSPFAFSSSSTHSVFGKTDLTPATTTGEDNTEGESERGTPTAEGENTTPGLLSSNPLDEEGAGEENEETVHTVKAKAFKLSKGVDGPPRWLQLGTGMLRIKKDKDTSSRRLLLRNSTNGKVIVNFKIYSALKPTQNKAALSFVGHEDGQAETYSIRVAKEEDAKNLKDALDREIAFVKEKDTTKS